MEIKDITPKPYFKGDITYRGIFALFGKHLARSQAIIDIGAGNGSFIKKLKERFPDKFITGIDQQPEAANVLKQDLAHVEFPDGKFDAIVCTDVIEHLPTDVLRQGLTQLHRILKKGGSLFVATLLEEDMTENICRCPDCGKVFHKIGHVQIFTRQELVQLLTKYGFSIQRIIVTHFGFFSLYPLLVSMIQFFHLNKLFNKKIQKLFTKDIILICQK